MASPLRFCIRAWIAGMPSRSRTRSIRQLRQERFRLLRQHADGRQPSRKEAGIKQAMVPDRVVEIVGCEQRRDRFEMRRLHRRCGELSHREVADAEHADISVTPGLSGDPFDDVEKILSLLAIEECPDAARATGAAGVDDEVGVAARNEKIGRAGLDEAERGTDVLNLTGVRREGNERRKRAVGLRLEKIGKQYRSVANRDADVIGAAYCEGRLAQVAVFASRRLDAIETAFAGSETGDFIRHDLSCPSLRYQPTESIPVADAPRLRNVAMVLNKAAPIRRSGVHATCLWFMRAAQPGGNDGNPTLPP